MTVLWEARPSPGKGNGVFAAQDIAPGTIILRDHESMRVYRPSITLSASDVRYAFDQLHSSDQQRFLNLTDGDKTSTDWSDDRLLRIFETNNFEDEDGCWVYPTICLCNHSCSPNAAMLGTSNPGQDEQLVAEKPIDKGEEIFISYKGTIFRTLTARQRQAMLRSHKGFVCSCRACSLPPELLLISDMRRQMISSLWHGLRGSEIPDLSLLDTPNAIVPDDYDPLADAPPRQAPLTESERTVYYYVLARLEQAEGTSPYWTASYLREAATYLLYQIGVTPGVVVLQSAKYVRDWMLEALSLMTSVRPPHAPEVRSSRQHWTQLQRVPQLKAALDHMSAHDVCKDEECFALQISDRPEESTSRSISNLKCRLLFQRDGD